MVSDFSYHPAGRPAPIDCRGTSSPPERSTMRVPVIAMALAGLLVVACARAPQGADPPRAQATTASAPAAPPPAAPPTAVAAAAPTARPLERVRIGAASPSLAYLPAHLAWKLGQFRDEGLDVEFVQLGGPTVIPALIG